MKPAILHLVAALSLAASAGDARADLRPPRHCELHGPQDLQPGDAALGVLKAHAGSLLRVCTAPGEAVERLVVSAPMHSSNPVCRFTQQALAGTFGEGDAPIVQTYVRVVCACEALPSAEKSLGWPARSGRLVLTLALDRIADYYRVR